MVKHPMNLVIFSLTSFKHSTKQCIPKNIWIYKILNKCCFWKPFFIAKTFIKYKPQDLQKFSLKLDLTSEVSVLPVVLLPRQNRGGMWSINHQPTKKHLVISPLQDKVQKTIYESPLMHLICISKTFLILCLRFS